eukprot:TRINITY_DN121504_c0_g1_i1.p1 TRINITY_DN121504_c0_g1~~TRINITY_DN121504_c0_g1_i1.p1  ORF type:complete len:550 (+),score=143.85 TRINITY_DN121504_c0_g1_i1:158-1807(+)
MGDGEAGMPWWVLALQLASILVLACLSALFSGLDLGLMSLDPGQLQILIEGGGLGDKIADRNADRARRVLTVRKDGNLLLCTVLLGNVAVNSCMAILMEDLAGGLVGFICTTVVIVTFGEIVPQSLCYRHGLAIGAVLLPILKFFRCIFFPLSKPIALLLDRIFGDHHGTVLDKNQMTAALEYQTNKDGSLLTATEKKLLQGSLKMSELKVDNVMVPLEKTFCIDINATVDEELLRAVIEAGYSQLPVVDYNTGLLQYGHPAITGLLHVKDLMVVDPDNAVPVKTLLALFGREFLVVPDDQPLLQLLRRFRRSAQLACVKSLVINEDTDPHWRHSGIVTMQDIVNAIVQEDLQEKETGLEQNVGANVFSNASGFDVLQTRKRIELPPTTRGISEAEAIAIQAFFSHTQPSLFRGASREQIRRFLREQATVKTGTKGEWLYQREHPSNYACLVLSGEVFVYAGREAFKSCRPAWSFLGQPSLATENANSAKVEAGDDYLPDFSAYPEEGSRLLILESSKYLRFLDAVAGDRGDGLENESTNVHPEQYMSL